MTKAFVLKSFAVAALSVVLHSNSLKAQQSVGVSGHVTGEGHPLVGARVRIPALSIDRATDNNGFYSFLIPGDRVAGQTVQLTVSSADRRDVYAEQTASLTLTGAALERNFDLKRLPVTAPGSRPQPTVSTPTAQTTPVAVASMRAARMTDTRGLGELGGATEVQTALAGRITALGAMTSSALGGSTSLTYRGVRSMLSSAQPLFVVDGIIRDNTTFTSSAQRYGAGGFDYGSPLQDINALDVASIQWLSGSDAVARYGGKAANGVVLISMKNGTDGPRFAVGASEQVVPERAFRVPSYQNAYGQGLGGKFQFFDGRGGGVNDGVAQNWGPALDGRPLAQSSYTVPRLGDVRFFNASPNNVDDYFADGRTTNTNVTIQARSTKGSVWAAIGQRQSDGVTPSADLRRRDVRLNATGRASDKLTVDATLAVAEMHGNDATGSGFNQSNPASQLTVFGRQVNMDSLRAHIRTPTDSQQISWNYAGQNNPFFSAFANDNSRERNHLSGGASAHYALSPELTATAQLGTDYYRDDRHFAIASTWMGGFPFYAGAGDFSKGGFQSDATAAQRSNGALRLDGSHTAGAARWSFSGGVDFATLHQRVRTTGLDSAVNVPLAGDTTSTAKAPAAALWTGTGSTIGVFGGASVTVNDRATLGVTLRHESGSVVSGVDQSSTYPAVHGSLDLARSLPALRFNGLLDALQLHASWYRAASDATPYALQTLYAGRPLTGAVAPVGAAAVSLGTSLSPEMTSGWDVGLDASASQHVDAGISLYAETTDDVLLPRLSTDGLTASVLNGGSIRNHGVEGHLGLHAGDPRRGVFWNVSANASLNYNKVTDLGDGVQSLALGPSQFGVTPYAMKDLPYGELVGYRTRRDPSGNLLLRAGLPVADSVAGPVVLGSSRQNTLYGFRGTLGYQWLSFMVAGDAHIGGSVFSATNYSGQVSGSFAETSFRPDSGLLINGIDAATGQRNTTHVTTEAYYHALGAIQEPWIYSASFVKLRELNLTIALPTSRFPRLPFEGARLSLIARNVYTWSQNKNFDPEALLSTSSYPGLELGQLPLVRTVGIQLSVTP